MEIMSGGSANDAWLDLQELYSSINFLKAKLSATDQKLRAASQESPIHVDGQGIPRMHCSHPSSLPTSSSQSRYVSTNIEERMHTTYTRSRLGRVEPDFFNHAKIGSQKKQERQSTFVEPVCINRDSRRAEPVWPLFERSTSGSLLGHVHRGGIERKARGHAKKKSFVCGTENIREMIDRQKQQIVAARETKVSSNPREGQFHTTNVGHVSADTRASTPSTHPDERGKIISRTDYLVPPTRKSSAAFNGNSQSKDLNSNLVKNRVSVKSTNASTSPSRLVYKNETWLLSQAAKNDKQFATSSSSFKTSAVNRDRNKQRAEKEFVVTPRVDSCSNTTRTGRQKACELRKESTTPAGGIHVGPQFEGPTGIERNFPSHEMQPHPKRKVALVQKLRGYPGFTHRLSSRSERRVSRIGKEIEEHKNMDVRNVLGHKTSEAGITKQTDGPLGNAKSLASQPAQRQLLSRSKSVKRKSQLHIANTGEGLAPKVRRYDTSAVREYMMRQKLLRKNRAQEQLLSSAAQVAAKEKCMQSLFALQRQAAVASARTGRRKTISLQKAQGPPRSAPARKASQVLDSDATDCNYKTDLVVAQMGFSQGESVSHVPFTTEQTNPDENGTSVNSCSPSESPSASQMHFSHNMSEQDSSSSSDAQEQGVEGVKASTTQEFRGQPTEQIQHIREMVTYIDRTINEELARIGCTITSDKRSTGSKAADVTSRIRDALRSFDVDGLRDIPMQRRVPSPEEHRQLGHRAASFDRIRDEDDSAAQKIQRWFRNSKLRKLSNEECSDVSEEDPRFVPVIKQEAECSFSKDTVTKTNATDISFYNLVPEPFTFARAMKLKSNSNRGAAAVFMTSTQSEGKLSPDFSVSTLDGDIAVDPERCRELSQRDHPVGDDTAVSVTLSAGETPAPIQTEDHSGHTQVAEGYGGSIKEKVASNKAAQESTASDLVNEDKRTLTPKHLSEVTDRTGESVWKLLSMQVEAAKVSAEASRRLGEVHGPSLLHHQSQELATLLTDSTVAAASALATSLTMQKASMPQNIPAPVVIAKQESEPSSPIAIQSLGGRQSVSADEQDVGAAEQHLDTKLNSQNSGNSGETECYDASLKDDDNNTSKSKGLEQNSAGSFTPRRWGRTDASKCMSPDFYSPLSTDQESSNMHEQSLSSISDPIILDKQLLSFSSVTSSYFLAPEAVSVGMPRLALLRLQEKSLVQKTRAELAWLEVLKRKCKECGAENKVPALRKKQRGLLLKLHDRCAQLKHMQESKSEAPLPLAQMQHVNMTPVASNSTPASEPSSHLPSLISSHESTEINLTEPVSALPEEYPNEEADADSSCEEGNTSSSSKIASCDSPDVAALNSSKTVLKEWQQHLEERRKNVQDLLNWRERLNSEETAVSTLERQAVALLKAAPSRNKAVISLKTSQALAATDEASSEQQETSSDQKGEGEIQLPVTEGRLTSAIVNTSSSTEDAKSESPRKQPFQQEHLPPGRGPLIKNPPFSRLKGRRDSSGSEDSFNVSYSETEQSDLEGQTLALREELKKRQLEAARLRKEQRRCHREFLRQKEHVLRKHIEMYDKLIEQAKADLEREKNQTISVRPQIKKPVVMEPHRKLSMDSPSTSFATSPSSRAALTHEEQSMRSSDTTSKISPKASIEAKEGMTDASSAVSQDILTEDQHLGHTMTQSENESVETSLQEVFSHGIMSQKPNNSSVPSVEGSLEEVTDKVLMESHQPSSRSTMQEDAVSNGVELITEISSSISEELYSTEGSVNIGTAAVESVLQDPTSIESASHGNASDSLPENSLMRAHECTENDPGSFKSQDRKPLCSSSTSHCVTTSTPQSVESVASSDMSVEDNEQTSSMEPSKSSDSPGKCAVLESIVPVEVLLPVVEVNDEVTENGQDCATDVAAKYVEESVHGTPTKHTGRAGDEKLNSMQVDSLVNSILTYVFNESVVDVLQCAIPAKTSQEHTATVSVGEGDSCRKEGCPVQTCKIEMCSESCSTKIMDDKVELDELNHGATIINTIVVGCTNSTAANSKDAQTGDQREDKLDEMLVLSEAQYTSTCNNGAKKCSTEIFGDENMDSFVRNMVSNAVSAVMEVAKEKRATLYNGKQLRHTERVLASQVSTLESSDLSDVSKKLNYILASLEQKKCHRELLRPQDMMVLSTDLDEDALDSKDLPCLDLKGVCKENGNVQPSSEGSKEQDSTMCPADISPLVIESDWFDDDLGLLAEQYAYPRQIPNKPPPPYSPPKPGSLLNITKKPHKATFVIPHDEKDVQEICRTAATLIFAAVQKGEDLDLLDWDPHSAEDSHVVGNEVEKRSRMAFCEFLFSLTKEVAQDTFCIDNVLLPPWHRSFSIHRKLPLPSSESQFMDIVSEKVLTLRGVGTRKVPLAQLSPAARIQRRKRADSSLDDEVDDAANLVLQREICQEDRQWVDYSSDEVAVKEMVADAILLHILNDTLTALSQLLGDP
ncbi:centrosome-associated protein 350-like isoform X2 [Ornithodoros turicata]|uniref:centrosome-associated protein 350-like isoform X2 n=1 Tax=Ornithodoros turicata TaxID=34597 RepID=UPI003138BC5F